MAVLALTNAKILIGQADLSGNSNMVEVSVDVDELDSTVFTSGGYKQMVGGMRHVAMKLGGLWDAGGVGYPDDRLFADLGVTAVPMTVSPSGAAVADTAYFTRVVRPSYSQSGSVGELLTFESEASGDGTALVRGQVADNQDRTATGTTTPLLLGAPTASQRLYCAIHVLAVSGTATPTLTPTLQGDTTGFPSPTTVVAGDAMTAVGSQWLQGPVGVTTDDYYRLSYVVSGTNPSFTLLAVIGVGA